MIINTIILAVMGICFVLGAVDRLIGNRFGLGEKFEEGIRTTGDLILTMAGMMVLSPLLAEFLLPVLSPMFRFFGADPAMFAGMFIANDMGALPLASRLTDNPDIVRLSGLILGSMLGATIVFTLPGGMKLIPRRYHNLLFLGVCFGLITIPFGTFLGGLIAGFSPVEMLRNLLPILIFIAVLTIGIIRFEKLTLRIFQIFGHILSSFITIGLIICFIQAVIGNQVSEMLDSIVSNSAVFIQIAMLLGGAFPAMHLLIKYGSKPCRALGRLLGIDEVAIGGMVACLANSIMTLKLVESMPSTKGKLLAITFSVSAAFSLGDHLAFTAAMDPDMILPVVVAKISAGIFAVLAALLYWKFKPIEEAADANT
ncbi:MAG: ethanolamine utilization protein EutH [Ruminococcaceae bacterium]|nr:ethanolamine utilization protein EutH [Oscillospiraceae bacterium]